MGYDFKRVYGAARTGCEWEEFCLIYRNEEYWISQNPDVYYLTRVRRSYNQAINTFEALFENGTRPLLVCKVVINFLMGLLYYLVKLINKGK